MRLLERPTTRILVLGTVLGFVILGGGGRLAMAAIQLHTGASPRFSVGGTLTVVLLGAAAGLAGAVLLVLSRFAATRMRSSQTLVEYACFGALLLLVTMRGLRGTAAIGGWYFYPLVAMYGTALARLTRQRRIHAHQSHRP